MLKKHLLSALSISSSSFLRAEIGANLVEKYKGAPEVREVLDHHDEVPKGSSQLLAFLNNWDAQHSGFSTSNMHMAPSGSSLASPSQ